MKGKKSISGKEKKHVEGEFSHISINGLLDMYGDMVQSKPTLFSLVWF